MSQTFETHPLSFVIPFQHPTLSLSREKKNCCISSILLLESSSSFSKVWTSHFLMCCSTLNGSLSFCGLPTVRSSSLPSPCFLRMAGATSQNTISLCVLCVISCSATKRWSSLGENYGTATWTWSSVPSWFTFGCSNLSFIRATRESAATTLQFFAS